MPISNISNLYMLPDLMKKWILDINNSIESISFQQYAESWYKIIQYLPHENYYFHNIKNSAFQTSVPIKGWHPFYFMLPPGLMKYLSLSFSLTLSLFEYAGIIWLFKYLLYINLSLMNNCKKIFAALSMILQLWWPFLCVYAVDTLFASFFVYYLLLYCCWNGFKIRNMGIFFTC